MAGSVIIIMGVSGSGKTSVGSVIAQQLHHVFIDGDDLHPSANIEKMSRGIPLDDEDRRSWLHAVIQKSAVIVRGGNKCLIACSALKRRYRDTLRAGIGSVTFVYLKASYEKVDQQLRGRQGHFMPLSLLESQFALLEEPGLEEYDVITIDVAESVQVTADSALEALQ